MEELTKHLEKVKIPTPNDKIYKDECVLSFDTPETPTGLYLSLTTFLGFGVDYVSDYFQRTGNSVFLHITRIKHEIPAEQTEDGPDKKITRLAIGTPGGFNPDVQKYNYEEKYEIVLMPGFVRIPYPNEDLPKPVKISIEAVLQAESALKIAEKEALAGTWDGEARVITRHLHLTQLNNNKKVPPSGWKCERCDLTTNLWLNLTDGAILCGRKFYDGTGGNDHAVEHFRNTGYPLAVKLGTIARDGKADVYSYDEDDMVEDPNLAVHLAHWGINLAHMEKTDKSMVELELELNQKFGDWIAMQEGNNKLTPMYGPGYTGLVNLGNSCYMNSVMQMSFTIPDFVDRFVSKANEIFNQNLNDPPNDFNTQMAKLGVGLLSGKYSQQPESKTDDENRQGIPPRMFKNLIGRGHPGFSSNRQQDAQEFILHLINILDRNSRHQTNPADCFKFKVEERYQCSSGKVKYTHRPEYLLPIPIPMDMVLNKEEVAAYEAEKNKTDEDKAKFDPNLIVRPRIKLSSCLESFAKTEIVEQFYSSALNDKTTATKTTRLASFPDYLLLHLKKFTVKEDWTPIKLDVAVEMPDLLDLNFLRGNGLQPTEELLPESNAAPPIVYDQVLLGQLADMGFPVEACKRSLYFTENRGLDSATQWLMEHISDADFSDPFVPPGVDAKSDSAAFVPNKESLEMVMSMGFTKEQATKALKATNNNLERAADWVFSHSSELDTLDMDVDAQPPEPSFRDGSGKYKLVGFVTHMGTSTMVGHYVCHLLKDGQWVIFNDEKVYASEKPLKELGYIYLYQRLDK
ncbi:ubiquitin carboxyl-terminal hydrolase 5 isoform X2 [Nasonia vitripennis]|uniref:Ubiquitin carboxyl-terminal hydrolase n=1 Tax=Nasonia vitripennis TaxID=7425 RepID=A0A7M7QS81_NASVI|nr:ubiquitin carboxyl-terminal hydrolase 5 isoform X2 [Nasonia vitripennis]XP_032452913.1 ubiquitin carboxyl-terminal hydrolase 5 isoform X2 [Nasonia vitripennis]XP_032452914.1 ubiquitin carboxyl-terminal hydrolase 5 isoform X2 [Nasonia vitripennis]